VRQIAEVLRDKLISGALGGIYLYISKKIAEFSRGFTKKTLKQWNDTAVKVVAGVAVDFIPMVRESRYLTALGDYMVADGIKDVVVTFVDKPADAWAESDKQIRVINLGSLPPSSNGVFIDGNTATYTVNGSADDFTITLSEGLSKGKHRLVVLGQDNKNTLTTDIYV
jgi:hypothetical protein